MSTAFATADELGGKLRRTFTDEEKEWIEDLLEDAASFLRGQLDHQWIYPRRSTTYTAYPSGGREFLPQHPVVSVDAVTRGGVNIPYTYREGYMYVTGCEPVDITFTFGYAVAPRELARLSCVLVSQTLLPLEAELGLTAGGLSSAQIDEFRIAWADGGAQSGMTLTDTALASLVRQFGISTDAVVETNR